MFLFSMAHNPPRVWMTERQYKEVADSIRSQQHKWHSLDDLADKMLARAAQGKNVVLSPGTAEAAGRALKGEIK